MPCEVCIVSDYPETPEDFNPGSIFESHEGIHPREIGPSGKIKKWLAEKHRSRQTKPDFLFNEGFKEKIKKL